MSSHTLAPTTICDLSHSLCWRPLTDLGHILSSVTYVCHPLWFVCGHRKGILTSPLRLLYCLYRLIQDMYTSPLRHTIQSVSVLLSSPLLIVCNHYFIQNVPVDIVTALFVEHLLCSYKKNPLLQESLS